MFLKLFSLLNIFFFLLIKSHIPKNQRICDRLVSRNRWRNENSKNVNIFVSSKWMRHYAKGMKDPRSQDRKSFIFFFVWKEQFSHTLCQKLTFTYAWYKNGYKKATISCFELICNLGHHHHGYGNCNLHKSERPFLPSLVSFQMFWHRNWSDFINIQKFKTISSFP